MSSSKDTRPTNDDSSSGSESESEHPVNKKYRLRSRSKSMEEREEERKKNIVDDDDTDESDSEFRPSDEDEVIDKKEYKNFLFQLFPSKHLKDQLDNSDEDSDDDDDDDDDVSDSDDYYDEDLDTEEEEEMLREAMHGMNFNIVFAIGQGDSDDGSDDDDDDDDGDDGDDENSDGETTPKKKRKTKKPRIYERIAGDNESTTDEETVTTKSRTKKQKSKSITAGKSSGASVTSSSTKTETKKNKEKEKEKEKERKPKNKKKKIMDEVSEDEIMQHILTPTRRKRRIKPKKVSDEKEKPSETKKKSEKDTKDDDDGIDLESAKQMIALLKTQKKQGSDGVLKQFEKIVDKENKKIEEKQKKIDAKEQVKNTREFRKQMRARDEYGNQYSYFKKLSVSQQADLIKELKRIKKHNTIEKPYVIKLLETNIPERYKSIALRKIETLNVMDPGGGEYFKLKQWVDTFMRIPFEKYAKLPVTIEDGVETCSSFMEKAKQTLDDAVFGLDDAKMQIMQMLGQWISNPESLGNAIAIKGPMGTGKTSLVKEGISKIMNRPFAFIPLGGATDSTYLEGHSYTYEGSIWGKIVDTLSMSIYDTNLLL